MRSVGRQPCEVCVVDRLINIGLYSFGQTFVWRIDTFAFMCRRSSSGETERQREKERE